MSEILQEPCLVLNRLWVPITFMPVKTCIVTAMRDMASVLDTENYLLLSFDEWSATTPGEARWIRTASGQIPAPEVVVLKRYGERPPRRVNFTRLNLARRDEFSCQYCGKALGTTRVTIDHVLPRSRGGTHSWENCVAACAGCNQTKADMTPKEARMPLRKKPVRPTFRPTIALKSNCIVRPAWEPFLRKDVVA